MKTWKDVFYKTMFIALIAISCNDDKKPFEDLSINNEFSPPRAGTPTTNPRLISSSTSSGKTSAVQLSSQLFAFGGNLLYRIQTDDRSYSIIGVDWGGTEAATVMFGNLFAVQGGHLWRCSLSSETCVDLGAAWGGTTFLTNDGTFVYGIQGGRIWKVNFNGGWAQLGNGDWTGSQWMSHTPQGLLVTQGGKWWSVNTTNGSWIDRGSPDVFPYIVPNPARYVLLGADGMFGVTNTNLPTEYQNRILARRFPRSGWGIYDFVQPVDPFAPTFGREWNNTQDLAWTYYSSAKTIWALKNSQIFELRGGLKNFFYNNNGAISGLANIYQITSEQSR